MNFEKIFTFLLETFEKHQIRYALMGGFALHASGYSRATEDIDILILKEDMPKLKKLLLDVGYEISHESEDVINFKGQMSPLGQVDFLLAHRQYTKNMLKRARECEILNTKFKVKVLIPEDIIGLKLQSSVNDPERQSRDQADIETLLRLHKGELNFDLLREYYRLFEREHELEEILKRIQNA